jgi:hypothetical protein
MKQELNARDLAEFDDFLTAPDPELRLMARCAVTGWHEALAAWVEAERVRGTDVSSILKCMMILQLQVAASVAGSLLRPPGHEIAMRNWVRMIRSDFVEHAGKIHRIQEAAR